MYIAISILIIITSILLTLVVLVQNSKGGGLAANFATGNQTFGVRQTADFLEKATWILACILLALCILAAVFVRPSQKSDTVLEKLEQTEVPAAVPEFPTTLPADVEPSAGE